MVTTLTNSILVLHCLSLSQVNKQSSSELSIDDDFLKNLIIFKELSAQLQIDADGLKGKVQRMGVNRGLADDNKLFSKFIIHLRGELLTDEAEESSIDLNFSDAFTKDIVEKVYKNEHCTSVQAVQKFVNEYSTYIKDALLGIVNIQIQKN